MNSMEISDNRPVFTLGLAHYHDPWHWHLVQKELARQGYDSIVPNSPIEDPDVTLDDHAEIIHEAEELYGAEQYIRVGWSWSGDIMYRMIGANTVSKLIFLAAPLRRVTAAYRIPKGSPVANGRTLLYQTWVHAEEKGIVDEFDPELIGNAFYNELMDDELKKMAISKLRKHPHLPEDEDDIAFLPELDAHYVCFERDWALRPDCQTATANLLGIEKSSLPTDHAPMLSRPRLLAHHLIWIANKQSPKPLSSRQAAFVN